MNKQQKTYLLLAAVIIIWGLVGLRFYKRVNPGSEVASEPYVQEEFTPKKFVKNKIYEVKADYRDPFLGKLTPKKRGKTKSKKKVNKKTIPFPKIIYNGIVKGGNTKSYTITINGKQEVFKIGESIHKVKLVKATQEYIVVRFNKVSKTIKLN